MQSLGVLINHFLDVDNGVTDRANGLVLIVDLRVPGGKRHLIMISR